MNTDYRGLPEKAVRMSVERREALELFWEASGGKRSGKRCFRRPGRCGKRSAESRDDSGCICYCP